MAESEPLDAAVLPHGITARCIDGLNGLRVHLLEAGNPRDPLILLLHGFPELAYSWRKIMLPLAATGAHVVAPDLRGYGRTTGWNADYDADIASFGILNLVRDALALVNALGHQQVAMVVGHDFGSSAASACALVRPDVFRSVVLMSAPFAGPPKSPQTLSALAEIDLDLGRLNPPRKHYHWYYATRAANADMQFAPQGLQAFLRAYYHHKSADWTANKPYPLTAWSAGELAKLPTYYVMQKHQTMAETVAAEMPSASQIAACNWLPDKELAVYAGEYGRTGFQGGLNWYRSRISGLMGHELSTFAGRRIEVPAGFIAGHQDWGVHQKAGDFETMQSQACSNMRRVHLIEGAGHWVQQEKPAEVAALLTGFRLATSG